MKILLVDDDEDLRAVGRLGLRIGAHDVIEAASGVEAVRQARAERPDVILLDLMMPGLDGVATLALLRGDQSTATIPVVFLTARASPRESEEYRALGAVGVIAKPFDPMTLASDVSGLVAGLRT